MITARLQLWTILAGAVMTLAQVNAAIVIPGADGSDGALNITQDTVIDLGKASVGNWNANNSTNSGNGIYDANKWAVVFKFTEVNIAAGAKVTFNNHPSRAPVVWLVTTNVSIAGTVSLRGQDWQSAPNLSEPGPGGFRGGSGFYLTPAAGASGGFGPGGGGLQYNAGYAGSYGTVGGGGPASYGNPSLIPLVGGSGGGGDGDGFTDWQVGGGAGGGAILIASAGSISIPGTIEANGGNGYNNNSRETGGGSGGGIRLIADSINGSGIVQAVGGFGWQTGGAGRVRIERVSNVGSLQISPDPSVIPLQSGEVAQLWMPETGPSVRIVTINGVAAPEDPRAAFGATGADISLAQTSSIPVVLETTNVEDDSTVNVRLSPRASGQWIERKATLAEVLSTSPRKLRWIVEVPVNGGYSAIQARVIRP